jgi:hypothetical protein
MTTLLGVIGASALWLLFAWLGCAIVASYLSGRKGYGEKIGLAFGLLLVPIGVLAWLVWPAKPESDWKVLGPFGRAKGPEAAVTTAPGDRPTAAA